MFVELLMKKNGKILFAVFLLIFVVTTGFGVSFVINTLNTTTDTFVKDGYALYLEDDKNTKAESYSFLQGTDYKEKNSNDTVTFKSTEGNVKVDNETIIHYADNSLGVLKKVVGLDVSTINKDIIFYYNIYKKTNITSSQDGYNIKLTNDDTVKFKNLLVRVSDNKFLLTGKNVRLVLTNDEIIDFGDYVEFEYYKGNVVKIYNHEKYYQTISTEACILVDDIKIDLKEATVYKENKRYISLTNLVIDNNSNIDTLEEETKKLEINDTTIDTTVNNSGTVGGGTNSGSVDGEVEVEEDDDDDKTDPIFKVTELELTPLKIDAKIEITDDFSLISSDITVNIIENATSKKVYEEIATMGDTSILVSYADLTPDTEYTLQAIAKYNKDDVEYDKTFLSKIFRTEDLGVTFEKSYATDSSIILRLNKENYSKVTQVKMELYSEDGSLVDYNIVNLRSLNEQEVAFSRLESNTKYLVKLTEILCQGVVVDKGYSIKQNVQTLKKKPIIGDLTFEIDKKNAQFNLIAESVIDADYGILKYRYEVYHASKEIETALPIISLTDTKLSTVNVKVDNDKISRGSAYTYRLVLEFDDNEKIIEYSKDLGTSMTIDGVEHPTVRFDKETAYITWEQINGTIIVEDPSSAVISDTFQIVYKNSVDIYREFKITADASTGNIPINVNNLRQNETYTFYVYGDINLQDNNPTEYGALLGSVVVKTKVPQSLDATFVSDGDKSDAFRITFMLKNPLGMDSSFEASTLSEMKFTLYKGSTIDGAQEVYRRVIDSDDDPYISVLKHDYYDQPAIIDPEFFGRKNSEFVEDVYTLQISEAYDYTTFKNEIPIGNNTYTFKLNAYIPELPEDVNDAVTISTITNSSAEAFDIPYDPNLDPNITIGYYLVPKFINENKSAHHIVWHTWIYNHIDKKYEELTNLKRTQNFNEDGTLEPALYLLDYGTSADEVDRDKLRRGNEYYFTYEIWLDLDKNGEVETEYPKIADEDVVLRSISLSPSKQTSKIQMYPSISTSTSVTYKYKIQDIDKSLAENKLYSMIDGSATNTSEPTVLIGEEEYKSTTFTGLKEGSLYMIKKEERLQKKISAREILLQQQMMPKTVSSIDLTYTVTPDVNKLIIQMKNETLDPELINKIAFVDVIITPTNAADFAELGSQRISGLKLDNESIFVDFFSIYQYLSKEINVGLEIYFDSGKMGFEVGSEYVALQKVTTDTNNIYYIFNNLTNRFEQNSTINNSVYEYNFDPENKSLKLTNLDKRELSLTSLDIDQSGVIYDKNNIILKELKKQLLMSDSSIVEFDLIIPGITMYNSTNKLDITSLLDSAELNAKIINLNAATIQDNLIYIDVYQTDENGQNAQQVQTITENIRAFFGPVTISNLLPETNYFIKFYAKVWDNSVNDYVKKYLYDIDHGIQGYEYKFYTLSKIHVQNINVTINETSYTNKSLNIKYTIDSIYGYDRIEYKLEKLIDGEYKELGINIPASKTFFPQMNIDYDINTAKETNITYGGNYKITIKPIGYYTKDGEEIEMDLGTVQYSFQLENSQIPYVGISAGKTAMSVYYRVSVSDPDYIIVNGIYTVTFKDSKGVILAEPEVHDINTINRRFEFSKRKYPLEEGKEYTIQIAYTIDKEHSGKNLITMVETKSIVYGDKVSVGSIAASGDKDMPTSIDLIFSDSYKLDSIDTIQYTLSSATTDISYSKKEAFNITYDQTNDLYHFIIDLKNVPEFIENNMYTIGMNFYSHDELIAQEEVNYYYKN